MSERRRERPLLVIVFINTYSTNRANIGSPLYNIHTASISSCLFHSLARFLSSPVSVRLWHFDVPGDAAESQISEPKKIALICRYKNRSHKIAVRPRLERFFANQMPRHALGRRMHDSINHRFVSARTLRSTKYSNHSSQIPLHGETHFLQFNLTSNSLHESLIRHRAHSSNIAISFERH